MVCYEHKAYEYKAHDSVYMIYVVYAIWRLPEMFNLTCVNTSIQLDIRMFQITNNDSLAGGEFHSVELIWGILNTGCKLGDD